MSCCVVRPSRSIPTTLHIFSSPGLNARCIGCGWMRGARPVSSVVLTVATADCATTVPAGVVMRLLCGCGLGCGGGVDGLVGCVGRPANGSVGPVPGGILLPEGSVLPS